MSFYAVGHGSRVYHIVLDRDHGYTLCGLELGVTYTILAEKPETGVICKHCERQIQELDSSATD